MLSAFIIALAAAACVTPGAIAAPENLFARQAVCVPCVICGSATLLTLPPLTLSAPNTCGTGHTCTGPATAVTIGTTGVLSVALNLGVSKQSLLYYRDAHNEFIALRLVKTCTNSLPLFATTLEY